MIKTHEEILNKLEARLLNISEPQRLLLLLMTYATFNNFNGISVVKDLVQNRDLWKACLMWHFIDGLKPAFPLLPLRDLHSSVEKRLGYPIFNVNTLYVLTTKSIALRKLALEKSWKYDSCYVMSKKESSELMGGLPLMRGVPKKEKNLRLIRFWWA